MIGLPNPVLIWPLALGAFWLGLRQRRRRRSRAADRLPAFIRMAARVPVPEGLESSVKSTRLTANAVAAGFSPRTEATQIARARVALAGAGVAIGVVLTALRPAGIALGALLAALGYATPAHWLSRAAQRRRARVVHELPDLIDLVVICTESGMALEPSMRLAADRLTGPLAKEVAMTMRELDLGTPRRAAYASLAARMGIGELTGLIGALLQAEELGAPIAAVLRRQATLLRSARSQEIREHAARAAPRVQLVVAMVMVPAALLVVLGMLIIHLIDQVGGVMRGGS